MPERDHRAAGSKPEHAPLLCAGIIGYQALRRTDQPPTGRLGISGSGASAYLTAQVAIAEGATVQVLTHAVPGGRMASLVSRPTFQVGARRHLSGSCGLGPGRALTFVVVAALGCAVTSLSL